MRVRSLPALAASTIVLAACGTVDPANPAGDVLAIEQALGEQVADRPSYAERLAHYAGNRSRMDPSKTGWPNYPAVPPLLWHDQLGQSGRAHSQDMHDTMGCFMHPSCDGTDPFVRIKMYWKQPFAAAGENIAGGNADPQAVIQDQWINEKGAPAGEHGHRDSTFSATFHYVGLGFVPGGTWQLQNFWTEDFTGVSPPPAIPRLSSGSHFPETVTPMSFVTFGTIYFDAAGVKPDRVEVVIDGATTALPLLRGKPQAGAYEGGVKLASGCHRYYFRATVAGKGAIYPDAGTLGVATSDAKGACPAYSAGGVSVDPTPGGGGDGGSGGGGFGHGGCSMADRAAPRGAAWPIALSAALALVARGLRPGRGRASRRR